MNLNDEKSIQEILNALPKVNANRNYWFVRTEGGDYYDSFLNGEYIAYDYNEITLENISIAKNLEEASIDALGEKIKSIYKEEQRPYHVAHQLVKFTYQIKKGDVVLIPSVSSSTISFGIVQETPVYLSDGSVTDACPYYKRKRVKWYDNIMRDKLDPILFKLMFSHHAITEANYYSSFIDRIMNSFFIKDENAFMILDVKATGNLSARSLFDFGTNILDIFDEFCTNEQLEYESDKFNVKIRIQSPGGIDIFGPEFGGIVVLGLLIVSIVGGKFSITKQEGLKISSSGLIKRIQDFLESNSRTKILAQKAKEIELKDPEDLKKVIDLLDKK